MQPFYQDKHRTLYNSDCRSMPELEDNSIQCVVTSPPYWGLRKYAGEQDLIWGGDKDCVHEWIDTSYVRNNDKTASSKQNTNTGSVGMDEPIKTNTCSLCGAWRGAYGLEPTPELYVEHSIQILREIRRVLRKDGVVFWNVGDSYNGSGGDHKLGGKNDAGFQGDLYRGTQPRSVKSLKPKDLCLIPFRVAIAAQQDGWWIRSVIIWNKPNPMPESVKDRPTDAYEHIIMLTKSARYYWDQEAVRENLDSHYCTTAKPDSKRFGGDSVNGNKAIREERVIETNGRNLRNVWTFSTQPYPEAHFATFPEKLPELCIKAATKENDIVLDPFSGAGTTLKVAAELNRRSVGYELSEEYCQLIIDRNKQQVLC